MKSKVRDKIDDLNCISQSIETIKRRTRDYGKSKSIDPAINRIIKIVNNLIEAEIYNEENRGTSQLPPPKGGGLKSDL